MARDEAYREAEKKIEQARRSGATELDLNHMKLTELPESLGQLTQLQTLYLADNQLTALPEWLGQLIQLHELDIRGSNLGTFPDFIRRLKHLRTLFMYRVGVSSIPEWLGELTELRGLYVSSEVIELPVSLASLRKFGSLDLTPSSQNPELAAACG